MDGTNEDSDPISWNLGVGPAYLFGDCTSPGKYGCHYESSPISDFCHVRVLLRNLSLGAFLACPLFLVTWPLGPRPDHLTVCAHQTTPNCEAGRGTQGGRIRTDKIWSREWRNPACRVTTRSEGGISNVEDATRVLQVLFRTRATAQHWTFDILKTAFGLNTKSYELRMGTVLCRLAVILADAIRRVLSRHQRRRPLEPYRLGAGLRCACKKEKSGRWEYPSHGARPAGLDPLPRRFAHPPASLPAQSCCRSYSSDDTGNLCLLALGTLDTCGVCIAQRVCIESPPLHVHDRCGMERRGRIRLQGHRTRDVDYPKLPLPLQA